MSRKNVISIVFLFKGPKTRDTPGASPRHYGAFIARLPVLPMNRRCPHPKKRQGWHKGGGGRSIQQESSRRNMT
ncbi:MAG TPA: hypothetical protein VN227_00750, partial [Methanoregula sp.]|nr:hypothetical protein [Methanoregula sp.]